MVFSCKKHGNNTDNSIKQPLKQTVKEEKRLPYYHTPTFTPYWLEDGKELPEGFHRIPDFKLINQQGETITQETVKDKTYVVNFFFTGCPGICPSMMKNLAQVQKKFLTDDNVLILSHSVTPSSDTPKVLQEYADDIGAVKGKWHLLTGERESIYKLGRKSYFVEESLGVKKTTNEFLHTENLVLIKDGFIRGIYNGVNKTSVNHLLADIKLLGSINKSN